MPARVIRKFGLAGLLLYAAVADVFRPAPPAAEPKPVQAQARSVLKIVLMTAIAGLVLQIIAGLLFIASGIYYLGADRPHFAIVQWLLQTIRTRSVKFHSEGIQVPDLRDRSLLKTGFALFRKNCQPCHGAPGVPAEQIGRGINPKPPQLATAATDWSQAEVYWIVSHGLKMSGMPAFSPRLSDQDRWAIVAFLDRLGRFSPAEYKQGAAAVDQGMEPASWGIDDERGFARIKSGNHARGRQLLNQYGCATCHTIPGAGSGQMGPPLTALAERQYLAGSLVNVPTNAMNWIMDPKQYKPQTAMPKLGVNDRDAVDITAYLYTLGSPKRIAALQRPNTKLR